MKIVRVAAIDPAMANFGVALLKLTIDQSVITFEVEDLHLIQTEKRKGKVVRQNSDDLRRAQELVGAYHGLMKGCSVCFVEVPTGAQSARAMFAFGMAIGVMASCPIPVIQVQPFETKLATVGTKTASKEEMIDWATELYPTAPWLRARGKPDGAIVNHNEHLADAVAIAHAGVKTDQFKQLMAMWRSTSLAA